ncbi:MAG TPA: phosphate ABC transporter substrate-binding protein PstS [Longimicrobiaceae bacterium]|nr:phosphate ABC transporter substrate-binding protein PstS [Longimicrobiaceae bacterium]
MHRPASATLPVLLSTLLFSACGGDGGRTPDQMAKDRGGARGGVTTLTGAGATFPYPIYSAWFAEYGKQHPVRVNYQSIGSGGGIRQVIEKTVDFGASDAPMTDAELGEAPGTLHVPTVLGSVAVTYNLAGLAQPLRLDGATLAAVYLGRVRKWNAPEIAALNPGVALPDADILPVYRTDGSGTTYVFTDYLAAVSPEWKQQVGTGKSVRWPAGLGAKGNEGVTGQVKQSPGSIGYVELAYALQNGLPATALRNQAGQFVQPSVEATSAAAADLTAQLRDHPDFRLSIVNAPGAQAYPVSAFTYLLVPAHFEECARARALVELVRWTLTQGGDLARSLHYAPLPEAVRGPVLETLGGVTCGPDRQPAGGSA